MNRYFIIVAGGKGLRMGGDIPKQFLELQGLPVLMHTVKHLHECSPEAKIILVIPQSHESMWKSLVEKYHFEIPVQIAYGGKVRFESVKNGLQLIPDDEESLVAIHDGVRPFVAKEVVENCFLKAEECGTAIPAINPVESVRLQKEGNSTEYFNRDNCYLVQTPQTFRANVLKEAYKQPYKDSFTDDASVVETTGMKIELVKGNRENIKLTTPFDLLMAKALLSDN